MKKPLLLVALFLISMPLRGQQQAFRFSSYDDADQARYDLPYLGQPIALIPSRATGPIWNQWEGVNWIAIHSPNDTQLCDVPLGPSQAPSLTIWASVHCGGIYKGPIAREHNSINEAMVFVDSLDPENRKGCVIVRDPRAGSVKYWSVCHDRVTMFCE